MLNPCQSNDINTLFLFLQPQVTSKPSRPSTSSLENAAPSKLKVIYTNMLSIYM